MPFSSWTAPADLLADFETRVVVPLVSVASFGRRASRLHPQFTVDARAVVMATHLVAAVRRGVLGARVASLADQRDTVISAMGVLLSGV